MAQSIQRELEEIEVKQKELEDQGVRLEKSLRGEDGGWSLFSIKMFFFLLTKEFCVMRMLSTNHFD